MSQYSIDNRNRYLCEEALRDYNSAIEWDRSENPEKRNVHYIIEAAELCVQIANTQKALDLLAEFDTLTVSRKGSILSFRVPKIKDQIQKLISSAAESHTKTYQVETLGHNLADNDGADSPSDQI